MIKYTPDGADHLHLHLRHREKRRLVRFLLRTFLCTPLTIDPSAQPKTGNIACQVIIYELIEDGDRDIHQELILTQLI